MEDTKKENTTNATVNVAETLTDLPVAEQQAGETKGGDYNTWRTNFGRTT